uniref:alpha-glucosidase n=1 Tax=Anopheles epiroticus TaxID=199890 RepID=A0A182P5V8_9DIPT
MALYCWLALLILGPFTSAQKDWWETASFYQIYPRSFQDSNGDGIGDLNGIKSRLPYLKSLGMTAFWLSPIYPSPMADFGYDISNFTDIHPSFGTLTDFRQLVQEAKQLQLRIILDFVPNHSSDEHEWFKKSVKREQGYEDFYVWQDPKPGTDREPPNNWVEAWYGSAWEWNEERNQFYLHQFHKKQPDLNYRNPAVVQAMKDVLRFWLDQGVDGFRIDAVPWLFETVGFPDEPPSGHTNDPLSQNYLKHIYTLDQPETVDMVYQWRELMDQYKKEHNTTTKILMTEAWSSLDVVKTYFNDSNNRQGSQMPFNFQLILRLDKYSKASDFKTVIDSWLDIIPLGHTPNWVLGNHDKRRVSSRMGGDHMVDIMAMIELTLPGITVTYQGEEIGMQDVDISWTDTRDPAACQLTEETYQEGTRDPARTPFQWDSSANAGFTNASVKPWLPLAANYALVNVQTQQDTVQNSHLKVFKELMHLRTTRTLIWGSFKSRVLGENVYAIVRAFPNDKRVYVVLANIGANNETIDATVLDSTLPNDLVFRVVSVSSKHSTGQTVPTKNILLQPYESAVLTNRAFQAPQPVALLICAICLIVAMLWSTVIISVLLLIPSLLADEHWWQHANFYQIYPRSFKDSDGDGVGDLRGVLEKVPYLRRELGIDAIWLSPIFKSPMADFGYDIADFRDIHAEFGTIADLEALATACDQEGLKLILDFVPNHSSDESEWFIKSVNKDPIYSDYYVWHPGKTLANGTRVPPSNWVSVFRGPAWEWNDVRKEYYLHQFLVKQPDLNYRNPALVQEMMDVMKFWLDKGVHGFRIDAVPYLFESQSVNGVYPDEEKSGETDDPDNPTYLVHTHTQNLNETFDMIYQWRKVVDDHKKQKQTEDIVLMAEAYTPLLNIIRLFGDENSDGAHIPFNFEVLSNTFRDTTGKQFYGYINRWLDVVPPNRYSNWVLGNHDNKRVSSRLGVARADLYQIALNVLPGIAVTYNGDELAMEDVFISWKDTIDPAACNSNPKDYLLYSRDPVRTPFQWDDSVSAGFSTNRTTWLPVASNYKTLNYKTQKAAPRSHVKIFKALVRLRKQRTLREGSMEMQLIGDNIIAIKRHLEGVSTIVAVLNFNKTTETVKLSSVFHGLPAAFEVITSSLQTNYMDGSIVPRDEIVLPADAAIVLEGNVANGN